VQDENYFCKFGVVENCFHDLVAVADVLSCIVEVPLDKALDNVKEDAVSEMM
jgi:hypothetical protein